MMTMHTEYADRFMVSFSFGSPTECIRHLEACRGDIERSWEKIEHAAFRSIVAAMHEKEDQPRQTVSCFITVKARFGEFHADRGPVE